MLSREVFKAVGCFLSTPFFLSVNPFSLLFTCGFLNSEHLHENEWIRCMLLLRKLIWQHVALSYSAQSEPCPPRQNRHNVTPSWTDRFTVALPVQVLWLDRKLSQTCLFDITCNYHNMTSTFMSELDFNKLKGLPVSWGHRVKCVYVSRKLSQGTFMPNLQGFGWNGLRSICLLNTFDLGWCKKLWVEPWGELNSHITSACKAGSWSITIWMLQHFICGTV